MVVSTMNDHNEAINNGAEFIEEEEDRLSSLPDSLLLIILNLLPINVVVATSVLSRRWRHLWTHITHLSLVGLRNVDQFVTRLDHVLSRLNSSKIHTFDLAIAFPSLEDDDFVVPWISRICSLNPEVIKVHLGSPKCRSSFQLPTCILQTRSLVYLEMTGKIEFKLDDDAEVAIDLPNLKRLHVVLPLSNLSLIETLFKSCASLEHLTLCLPLRGEGHSVVIAAPNLKCLDVVGIFSDQWKVVVDTPKLEQFYLGGDLATYQFVQSPSTLQNAKILLRSFVCKNDTLSKIQGLFQGISHARSLRLAPVCGLLLSSLDGMALHNLVDLSLGSEDWVQILRLPVSLLAMLKTIKLSSLLGTNHELKLLKSILTNATVLEELHVSISKNIGKKDQLCMEYNFCKELFMLSRSSSNCQIKFSGLRITASSNDMRDGVLTCQIAE